MNKEDVRVNGYTLKIPRALNRRVVALLVSLLLLLTAMPAFAQEATTNVLIRVADATGRPVERATVEVYELGLGLVTLQGVAQDGLVRIPYTQSSTRLWQARATAPGYEVQESGWFDPAQGGVHTITLEPVGGELQLYIRDGDGRSSAQVTLLTSSGRLVAQGASQAGRWVARDLAAGEYRAVVTAAGMAPVEKRISVARGRVTVEAITLTPGSISATGEVLDGATGTPLRGAKVELVRGSNLTVAEASTNVNGRFSIQAELPSDKYRLRVSMPGYTPVETDAESVLSGGYLDYSGLNRITIYPATATIEGTLVTATGRAITSAEMVLMREGFGEVATTKVDQQGRFRFQQVPAGMGSRYKLVAHDAIDSITVDHVDLAMTDWFTANPGGKLEIPVVAESFPEQSARQSTVNGTVLSPTGQPVEGAKVELIRRSRVEKSTTTDADGRFTFPYVEASQDGGLVLAPYMLRVSKDGYITTREVVATGAPATTFHVPSAGQAILSVTLNPAMTEAGGRVVDQYGRAVQGAEVSLVLADGTVVAKRTTDASGWYRLGAVPANTNWAALQVEAEGFLPSGQVNVTEALARGEALPTVRLVPGAATLDGVVVDLQGRPVAGAKVRLALDGQVAAETVAETDGYYSLKTDVSAAAMGLLVVEGEGYSQGGIVISDLPSPGQSLTQAVMINKSTAEVTGRVLDQNGMPVAGTRVELVVEGTGVTTFAVTGADGSYRLEQPLPAGAAWAWLRVRPATGTFAGSLTHNMDMAPIIRLTSGDSIVTDLLVRR